MKNGELTYCLKCKQVYEVYWYHPSKKMLKHYPGFPSLGLTREDCPKCGGVTIERKTYKRKHLINRTKVIPAKTKIKIRTMKIGESVIVNSAKINAYTSYVAHVREKKFSCKRVPKGVRVTRIL